MFRNIYSEDKDYYTKTKISHAELASNAFKQAWINTFAPSGWDPITKQWNGKNYSKKNNQLKVIVTNRLTNGTLMATSFLGLPNHIPNNEDPSIKRILKNLFGVDDSSYLITNVARGIFAFPFYASLTLLKFGHNLLKLTTELPFLFAANFFLAEAERAIGIAKRDNKTSIGNTIGTFGLYAISQAFFITHALVRTVTSPIESVKYAWKKGNELGKVFGDGTAGKVMGILIGGTLSLASIAITASVYAVALPLLVNTIAPVAAGTTPAVATFVSKALHFLAPLGKAMTPALTTVGIPVATYTGAALTSIGLFAAAAITTIGLGITELWSKYKASQYKNTPVKEEFKISLRESPKPGKIPSTHAKHFRGLTTNVPSPSRSNSPIATASTSEQRDNQQAVDATNSLDGSPPSSDVDSELDSETPDYFTEIDGLNIEGQKDLENEKRRSTIK